VAVRSSGDARLFVAAPTLVDPGAQSGVEGEVLSLPMIASDADGDALRFSASGLPPDLVIDPDTGLIEGTLAANSAGTYPITVVVDDLRGGSDAHPESLLARFSGSGETLTLDVVGHDIGSYFEVAVYANDTLLGWLRRGPATAANRGNRFHVPASLQVVGVNTLRFVQHTPGPTATWGVTELLLADP
jgi:hypothetical protein